MPDTPPDLSLVPVDVLLQALKDRHDLLFFVGRPLGSDETYEWRIDWAGEVEQVLGLIQIGSHALLSKYTKERQGDSDVA